jgi:hypothetical protein
MESLAGSQRQPAYKRKRNGEATLRQSSDCRIVPEARGNSRDRAIGGENAPGKASRRRGLDRNRKPASKTAEEEQFLE